MEVEQLKNVTYEIVSAVRLAHNNDEVAAIVLTGAGEKAFVAGLFGLCFATEDMREGTSAFLEKRKAEFKGR